MRGGGPILIRHNKRVSRRGTYENCRETLVVTQVEGEVHLEPAPATRSPIAALIDAAHDWSDDPS